MKGVIAAGHEVTAKAGADILRAGGNAFDAALAAMFASTVPETVLSSIGGGGFLMAHRQDPDGDGAQTDLYDFFVDTPLRKRDMEEIDFHGIDADFGPATQEFHIGVGSSASPGIIPGAYAVHKDLCTLPMSDILAPAIKAAREGVAVDDFHAYLFTIIRPILMASPAVSQLFAPEGTLLKSGEIFQNEALAETLEQLARQGEALFSHGAVGQSIVRQSSEEGGHLSFEDLNGYEVIKRAPLFWRHGEMTLALNPAPAQSGALIAYGLGLIDEVAARKAAPADIFDLVEVMSLTNRARADHGSGLVSRLDRDIICAQLDAAFDHKPFSRGTTQISVIDENGNGASVTLSNGEGNGHMVGDHGFMLNNMLGEDDLHPQGFHQWETGKRLSTMMAPTIMTGPDGELLALGSGGSNRIRTAILQVLHYLIDQGKDLAQAVEHPRVHLERDGVLSFEDLFGDETRSQLLKRYPDAHPWPEPNMFYGGVHCAERLKDGLFAGAGDPRRNGVAIIVE